MTATVACSTPSTAALVTTTRPAAALCLVHGATHWAPVIGHNNPDVCSRCDVQQDKSVRLMQQRLASLVLRYRTWKNDLLRSYEPGTRQIDVELSKVQKSLERPLPPVQLEQARALDLQTQDGARLRLGQHDVQEVGRVLEDEPGVSDDELARRFRITVAHAAALRADKPWRFDADASYAPEVFELPALQQLVQETARQHVSDVSDLPWLSLRVKDFQSGGR